MRIRIIKAGLVLALILAGATIIVMPANSSHYQSVELQGLTYPYPHIATSAELDEVRDVIEAAPVESKTNLVGFQQRGGFPYILATDRDPKIADANITAYFIPTPSLPTEGILYELEAQSSYSTTPEAVEPNILSPSQLYYAGSLVEISDEHLVSVSWEMESDSGIAVKQSAVGLVPATDQNRTFIRYLRHRMIKAANSTNGPQLPILSGLPKNTSLASTSYNKLEWWKLARGTLKSGILFDQDGFDFGVTKDIEIQSKSIDSTRGALAQNRGKTVRFQADLVGMKLSTRDALVRASSCPPDMIGQAGTCVPAVLDATLHGGLVVNDGKVLAPYVGANNEKLSKIASPYQGRFELTARIVNASVADPRLNYNSVIQIIQAKRIGDTSVPDNIRQDAISISGTFKQQLQFNKSEWDGAKPTPTPTRTSTPDVTPGSATDNTPTESEDEQERETMGGSGPGFTAGIAVASLMSFLAIRKLL